MEIGNFKTLRPIPVLGSSFTKEELCEIGLGSTTERAADKKLSVDDQRKKSILDEQHKNGKPLWCSEEEETPVQ